MGEAIYYIVLSGHQLSLYLIKKDHGLKNVKHVQMLMMQQLFVAIAIKIGPSYAQNISF